MAEQTDGLRPDEQQLCELLDSYLAAVQAGDEPTRAALLAAHPELSSWVGSFDALNQLASRVGNPEPVTRGETRTVSGRGSTPATREHTTGTADFGNFELLAEAGRGGMGVVYQARQRDLDRTVALKMILSSRLASPDDVRRFQQEARAVARLRHPSIVGVHEVGQVHGQHYFTMDFIAGQSLARLLESGPLEPDRAAQCLLAVARAVDYLHGHNIVHRDLKPSNILLDEREQPFVTDFGLAKVFQDDGEKTQTGAILGTPSYMAPEQARGETAQISPRTDVYSLGAVLYEMLTGRPPFREENQLNTLLQVMEGEPTLPSRLNRRIPPELQRICMCCLEKDPASRYASAAALADDLQHYLRHEPLEVRPIGIRQRLRRWSRRQPALVAHGSGLLCTALIVQVKYMVSGDDLPLHLRVMGVLGVWLLLSCVFQAMLDGGAASLGRYAWAATNVLLLTVILYLSYPPLGPLLIGYPPLVAASGLWFHVRLVVLTTLLSLVSYAGLLCLHPEEYQSQPSHYPLIFGAVLTVLGFIVAYQIRRLRVLSRYFEPQKQARG